MGRQELCASIQKLPSYKKKRTCEGGALILHFPYAKKNMKHTARVGPLCLTRNIDEEKTVRLSLYLLLFSSFLNAATTHEGTPNKKIRFETPRRIEKEEVVGDDNEEVLNDGEKGRE